MNYHAVITDIALAFSLTGIVLLFASMFLVFTTPAPAARHSAAPPRPDYTLRAAGIGVVFCAIGMIAALVVGLTR